MAENFQKEISTFDSLNPSYHGNLSKMYWMLSEQSIKEIIDMYPLTVDGLKAGIKKLMSDNKKSQ